MTTKFFRASSRLLRAVGVVVVASLLSGSFTAPTFAGVTTSAPTVRVALAGDAQGLVSWEAPSYDFWSSVFGVSGATGYEFRVTQNGSEVPVTGSCGALTADDVDCVFDLPAAAGDYQAEVRALYVDDYTQDVSPWGVASFSVGANAAIENLIVQQTGVDTAAIDWTNAGEAALNATGFEIAVDSVVVSSGPAGSESASLSALAVGEYVVEVRALNGADVVATASVLYAHQIAPPAPQVSVGYSESSNSADNTISISWNLNGEPAPTIVGWDVVVDTDAGILPLGCLAVGPNERSCVLTNIDLTKNYVVEVRALYGANVLGPVGYGVVNYDFSSGTANFSAVDADSVEVTWNMIPLLEPYVDSVDVYFGDAMVCDNANGSCVVDGVGPDTTADVFINFYDADGVKVSDIYGWYEWTALPVGPTISVTANDIVAGERSLTVELAYPGDRPASVTGYDIVVDTTSGAVLDGTCLTAPYDLTTVSCTITGIPAADSVSLSAVSLYGAGAVSAPTFEWIFPAGGSAFGETVETISRTSALVTLDPDALLDSVTTEYVISVDGVAVSCPDLATTLTCELTNLAEDAQILVEISAVDASANVLETLSFNYLHPVAPAPPIVTVGGENEFGVATVSWTYPVPAASVGINGWDVVVTLENGEVAGGTCGGTLAVDVMECTVTGASLTNGVLVEVTPTYGLNVFGLTGLGWNHATPFDSVSVDTSGGADAVVTWVTNVLFDAVATQTTVLVDGQARDCSATLADNQCVLNGFIAGSTHQVTVQMTTPENLYLGEISTSFISGGRPAAPVVTVGDIVDGTATISWTYPADVVAAGVNGWEVTLESLQGNTLSGTCVTDTFSVLNSSCTISGLVEGDEVIAEVVALYGEAAAGLAGYAVIGSLAAVSASQSAAGELSVWWVLSALTDVRAASVVVSVDGTEVVCADAIGLSQCVVSGLANGEHTLAVSALDADGTVIETTTGSALVFGTGIAPVVTVVSSGASAALQLGFPQGADTGRIGWTVNVISSSTNVVSGTCLSPLGYTNLSTCTLNGLDPAATYVVEVAPLYGTGFEGPAGYAVVNGAAVTEATAVATDVDAATVSWTFDATVDAYVDSVAVTVDGTAVTCADALVDGLCVVPNLVAGTTYEIVVTALDVNGNALGSKSLTYVFAGVPAAPTVSISGENEFGVATVSWTYAPGEAPADVTGYEVLIDRTDAATVAGTCSVSTVAADVFSCTITDVDLTVGIEAQVRPIYGADLRGAVGYAYLHVAAVSEVVGLTSGDAEATISWVVGPFFDVRTDSVRVTVGDVERVCANALTLSECVVTGLTVGETYSVLVEVLDADGVVLGSNTGSFTVAEVPAAPVVAVSILGDVATVSWTGDGNPAITGWSVVVTTSAVSNPTGTCVTAEFAADVLSCELSGLDALEQYEIQVAAIYGTGLVGEAGYSYINVTPVADFAVVPASASEALVMWTVDGFIAPRVASVVVTVDGQPYICPSAVEFSECYISNLLNGQVFDVAVTLYDANGDIIGADSGTFLFAGVPSAPTVSITGENEFGVATVTWGYDQGAVPTGVTGWQVTVTREDGTVATGTCDAAAFAVDVASCTITGVTVDSGILVEVEAVYGAGDVSAAGFAVLHVSAVASLAGLTSGAGEVTVTWSVNPLLATYVDEFVVRVDGNVVTCADALLTSSCVVSGLTPNTDYTVTVEALSNGASLETAATTTVRALTAPTAPSVTVVDNGTTATVSWSHAGVAAAGINGWNIVVNTTSLIDPTGTCMVLDVAVDVLSCDLAGLNLNESYEIVVTPLYGTGLAGDAGYGYIRAVAVSGLRVNPTGDATASLSWRNNALIDPRIDSIVVTQNGTELICPNALNSNACFLDFLIIGSTYEFVVTAYDIDGVALGSDTVSYTHAAPKPAPSNFTASAVVNGSVTLTWDYSVEENASIVKWDLQIHVANGAEPSGACVTGDIAAATRSCVLTGIDPTDQYFFELRADRDQGSLGLAAYTGVNTAPFISFAPIAVTQTSSELSFAPDFGWEQVVDSYVIRDGETEICQVLDVTVDNPVCTLSASAPGESFEYTIDSVDVEGRVINSTPYLFEQPALPLATNVAFNIVETQDDGTGLVEVTWDFDPQTAPAEVIGWVITGEDRLGEFFMGSCYESTPEPQTRSCEMEFYDIALGNKYSVTAIYGMDVLSDPVTIYRGPTAQVTNVAITPIANSTTTALVTFTPVEGVSTYDVLVSDVSYALELPISAGTAPYTFVVRDLVPADEIIATVRVIQSGVQAFEGAVSPLYIAPDVPTEPQAISVTQVSKSLTRVSWSAATAMGTPVTSYTVTAEAAGQTTVTQTVAANITQATFSNLPLGVSYTFTAVANSLVGPSVPAVALFSTINVPSAPTTGTVELRDVSTLRVNFTPPATAVGRSPVTGYRIAVSPGNKTFTAGADATYADLTGLSANTTYTIRVFAKSAVGESLASSAVTGTTVGTPTNFAVTVDGLNATATWTAPKRAGATYVVSALAAGSVTPVVVTVIDGSTSANFTGLTAGTEYTFSVIARYTAADSSTVDSAASSVVVATTPDVPNAPSSVSAALNANDGLYVTWSAPTSDATRASVSGYEYEVVNAATELVAEGTSVSAAVSLSGLTAGEGYSIRTRATSAVGAGTWSEYSTLVYVPGFATDVTLTQTSESTVDISWTAPQGDVTRYNVTAYSDGNLIIGTSVAGDVTSLTWPRLSVGTTFSVTIEAQYGPYNAGAGSEVSLEMLSVPTAPSSVSAALESATSATVSWTAPATSAQRSAVTGYEIIVFPQGGSSYSVIAANATSAVVTGLAEGVAHVFAVRALSAVGKSDASNAFVLQMPSKPGAALTLTGGTQASVYWTSALGDVTNYVVTLDDSENDPIVTTVSATTFSATISDLTPGATYAVTVHALYGSVVGPARSAGSAAIAAVPSAPTAPTVGFTGVTTANLDWTAPAASAGRASVTGYEIDVTPTVGDAFTVTTTGTSTRYELTGLVAGVGYSFVVRATSIAGSSEDSVSSDVVYAPAAVTAVTVVGIDPTTARLTWTAPAGDVTGYNIVADSGLDTVELSVAGDVETAVVPGLVTGRAYSFTIQPLYGFISAPIADAVTYTTSLRPVAPVLGSAELTSATSVQLSWNPPSADATRAAANGYQILVSPATDGLVIPTITNGTQQYAEVSGLTPGVTYSYSIRALSEGGQSPASNSIAVVTPKAPEIYETRVSGQSISVFWNPAPGTPASYEIVITSLAGSTTYEVTADTFTYEFTSLAPGTEFTIAIRTVYVSGYGEIKSSPSTTTGTTATLPEGLANVRVSIGNSGNASVSWDYFAALGTLSPTGFIVTFGDQTALASSTQRSVFFLGLAPGTTYSVVVTPLLGIVAGTSSDIITVTTPGSVTNVRGGFLQDGSMKITWDAAPGALPYYQVIITSPGNSLVRHVVASTETSLIVNGLDPRGFYVVSIRTIDGTIQGPNSTPITVLGPYIDPAAVV